MAAGRHIVAPPPPIPRLYDGWGAEWSAQHERWYFVNNHTQETTWDKPTGPAPGVESKVACSEETGDNNAAKEKGPMASQSEQTDLSRQSQSRETFTKVSINVAPIDRLASVLSLEMAEKIVEERNKRPIQSIVDASACDSHSMFGQ